MSSKDLFFACLQMVLDKNYQGLIEFINKSFGCGSLKDQEEKYEHFRDFCKSLYGENANIIGNDNFSAAAEILSKFPDVIADNRITKTIFRSLIDWGASGKDNLLSARYAQLARSLNCYSY